MPLWNTRNIRQNYQEMFPTRRHAEISPVKVKDIHLMNNNLPLAGTSVWRVMPDTLRRPGKTRNVSPGFEKILYVSLVLVLRG